MQSRTRNLQECEVSATTASRIYHRGGRETVKYIHICMTFEEFEEDEDEDESFCLKMDAAKAVELAQNLTRELKTHGIDALEVQKERGTVRKLFSRLLTRT